MPEALTLEPHRIDERARRLLEAGGGAVRGYLVRATPRGKVELVPWYRSTRVNRRLPDGRETPNRWNPKLVPKAVETRDGLAVRVVSGAVPVPEEMRLRMLEGLPPERRREARERYEALLKRLMDDMLRVKALVGRYVPPDSIAERIRYVAWRTGDPKLLERIEQVEPEAVRVYAAFLMEDAAAKQKEVDAKKVALDWHGHYNA